MKKTIKAGKGSCARPNAKKVPAVKQQSKTRGSSVQGKKPRVNTNQSAYAKGKERARNKAIQWCNDFADRRMSWNQLCDEQAELEKLGTRFGLTKEFRENGII